MKNWSINNRVLFITLFPLALVSLALNAYFTITRFAEMQIALSKQGRSLAFHLAVASEYGVISGNRDFLDKLAKSALATPEVVKVSIADAEHRLLISNEKEALNGKHFGGFFDTLYRLYRGEHEHIKFSEAIFSEKINIDDYPADTSPNENNPASSEIIGHADVFISLRLATYNQAISLLKSNMILMLIFLLSVYLTLRLSDEISRSISQVSSTVLRIEGGDLHARAAVESGGEIGQLSRGINAMATALQNSDAHLRTEIEKATANLKNSYIEIEKQNKRLVQARTTADAANQAKSNFLANISHEIRTPINGVIGFTDILLKTPMSLQQKEYTNTIKTAANSLMHLVNDLLDFARIESGKVTIESVSFDIRSVLENIHTIYSHNACEKGLELLINLDRKLPPKLISDPARIEQIFINLVSNAIKFTEQGTINIDIKLASSSYDDIVLQCMVSDTGIGLTSDECLRIFQKFEQADTSTSKKYGGTGLGLAITKNIVELLGGSIRVESEIGKGSAFLFTLKCGYSDHEADFTSYHYNDKSIYYADTLPASKRIYSRLLQEIGFKITEVDNPNIIECRPIPHKAIFIYAIDARYNIGKNADHLLTGYDALNIKKVAFVSSHNPDLHRRLRRTGFDYVIPKTINRTQLLNAFSANLIAKYDATAGNHYNPQDNTASPAYTALIVDDNDINVRILEAYLKPLNINTITASNGENALIQFKAHDVQLVFMDIHMPVMDGYSASRSIRDFPGNKAKVPIIGITADGLQKSIDKCLNAGMDHCMIKPITYRDVEEILNTWLFKIAESKPQSEAIIPLDNLTLMMIHELPTYREQLKIALSEQDYNALYQIAHKIAGGSAYCNMPELQRDSLHLQNIAKKDEPKMIKKSTQQLLKTIDLLLTKTPV